MNEQNKRPWTPGPWELYRPGRFFVVPARNFGAICELELNAPDRRAEQTIADAHLIAAAPTMYEALEAMVTDCPVCEGVCDSSAGDECPHCQVGRKALRLANPQQKGHDDE